MYVYSCVNISFHDLHATIYTCTYTYDASSSWRKSVHAECCCVLQCAAACCSVLQVCCECVASVPHAHCFCVTVTQERAYRVLHYVAVCCGVLQFGNSVLQRATRTLFLRHRDARACVQSVAVCCSVLQCVAVCCSVLQCVAVCCSVLQCVASALQCATHTHRLCVTVTQERACTHKEPYTNRARAQKRPRTLATS